jgi:glycosyltransferase involved in cell wall biosynthesis
VKTEQITILILTFNEASNLTRCLDRLRWAKQILVIDSGSTDETVEIAQSFPTARLLQRKFDTFAGQCNFGLSQVVTDWVLSLDADYLVTAEWVEEIKALKTGDLLDGYATRFKYCIFGRPLRSSLYPPRTVLYRREAAKYRDEGHGHRVQISGQVAFLHSFILHDDRKPLDRWLAEQNRYALAEATHLLQTPVDQLNHADRIRRRMVVAPWLVFLYVAFGRGLLFDGWPGWYYIFQRTLAEIMLSLRLLEEKLK